MKIQQDIINHQKLQLRSLEKSWNLEISCKIMESFTLVKLWIEIQNCTLFKFYKLQSVNIPLEEETSHK